MTPLTIAPPNYQLTLLHVTPSWRITKNAQARNAYGTVAAELVCTTLSLLPVPINGSYDVCLDAWKDGVHYEIKSVKHGGKVVIYDWRMEKETQVRVPLYYAILCHGVRGSDGTRLVEEMTTSRLELLLLPASWVHEVARGEPRRDVTTRVTSTRCGYNRTGYKDGYRNVPVRALRDLTPHVQERTCHYGDLQFKVTVRSSHNVIDSPGP